MRVVLLGTGGSAGVPHDRRAGRRRRLGRLRPGRAAQPPDPQQHRGRGRRRHGCWSIQRRTCARSCWTAASPGSTRCCSPTPMPTTSPGLDDVRHAQPHRRSSAGRLRHRAHAGRADTPLRLRVPTLGTARILPPGDGAAPGRAGRHDRGRRHGGAGVPPGPRHVARAWGCGSARFGYSTDVKALDDAAFAALAGVDTWVVGCFLRQGPHWTHADLPEVRGWAERIGVRRTVLTHMGTDMDWAWMAANLPAGGGSRLRRHGAGGGGPAGLRPAWGACAHQRVNIIFLLQARHPQSWPASIRVISYIIFLLRQRSGRHRSSGRPERHGPLAGSGPAMPWMEPGLRPGHDGWL